MYGKRGDSYCDFETVHRKITELDRRWPVYNSDKIDIMKEKIMVFDTFHSVNIVETVAASAEQWMG